MPDQGTIVLIPFPFSNLRSEKTRPVLVISCDAYNSGSPDFLGMAVTSNLEERAHAVPLRQKDLASGRLKADSVVRADKVYSLSRTLVLRSFGAVKPALLARVLRELDAVLGRKRGTA
ncbi:MAG: type II toxin-antitoxin system PemK/MazF family toxin [Deltaproteobacteria bacterium]|nr:type II toxin-antitoxin system PemK/MazF family toxin [Deltaproteobacteria bacterium]